MCEGYDSTVDDDHPDLEDEFLCEYVDGTMDPVVREVFEEYVRENPSLREHIECLRDTRLLLCHYGCRCHAPHDLQDRLRQEITCDLMQGQVPFHILVADRLKGVATISSAMALLLLIGLVGGVTAFDAGDRSRPAADAPVVSVQDLGGASPWRAQAKPDFDAALMPSSRLTPRTSGTTPLHADPSLVARGLEHELHQGTLTSFAVAHQASVFP